MQGKILTICVAAAALAAFMALPATSSAIKLEDTSGGLTTTVATGSKIKAIGETNSPAIFQTGELKFECNENFLTGTVLKEGGVAGSNIVEATIEDLKFQSHLNASGTTCKSSQGATTFTTSLTNEPGGTKHWCLKTNEGADTFKIFGKNCGVAGEGELTFALDISTIIGNVTCTYVRKEPLNGEFTTEEVGHNASTLKLTGEPTFAKEEPSGSICAPSFKVTQLSFNLYTDTATSAETNVWDDIASTADPVWFHK